jgi:hypothetical protein
MVHLLKETTMKFIVTACSMDRKTRMSTGVASRDEVIDTKTNEMFSGVTDPFLIEQIYETFWNCMSPHSKEIVKVIGVKKT